jgi:hypothetical protein
MSAGAITIPARLVPYLRRGAQSQLSARVDTLGVALEGPLEELRYREAVRAFDAARALLDAVGACDEDAQHDVELDLDASGDLVLKTLEAQYRCEVARLQDAEAHGVPIPAREVPELGDLVTELRRRVGASEAARRADALLESRGALRMCRSRDHG